MACSRRPLDWFARPRTLSPGRAAALAMAAGLACAPWASAQVQWKSAPDQPLIIQPQADLGDRLGALAGDEATRTLVVQLARPIDEGGRTQLRSAGMELLAPLGNNAFFARLDAQTLKGQGAALLAGTGWIRGVSAIDPAWKIDPRLLDRNVLGLWGAPDVGEGPVNARNAAAPDPVVPVMVQLHSDLAPDQPALDMLARHGADVKGSIQTIPLLIVELAQSKLMDLAREPMVQWLEPALPRFTTLNDSNRARVQANEVQAAPYNLNGAGVHVLVFDGGRARATHVDFTGRITTMNPGDDLSSHATHVAGTVAGSGQATSGLHRGMAPGAHILTAEFFGPGTLPSGWLYSNPADIEVDYAAAWDLGADVANNSIGTNVAANCSTTTRPCTWQGDYSVTDALIDAMVRGSQVVSDGAPFRIVWAGGNERGSSCCNRQTFNSTSPPAMAKNSLVIGAINSNDDSMTSFSSWGPTDDGRMRPDFVAPGCQAGGDNGVTSCSSSSDTAMASLCGTSMASPTVAGMVALMLQDFRAQFPSLPDPRNSTLKCLLATSAVDLGNPGPDNSFGYGSVRVRNAIDLMRTGNFLESSVSQNDAPIFVVIANPGQTELKIMLAWDDPAATPNVNPNLINDLDLEVTGPDGTVHFPWTLDPANPGNNAVRTAPNRRENLEQVFIANPLPGAYTVRVRGFNVPTGPQPFSLVATQLLSQYQGTFLSLAGPRVVTDSTGNGNSNGRADPGESAVALSIPVRNVGLTPGTSVTGTLVSLTPTAAVTSSTSTFSTLAPTGGTGQNLSPFVLSVSPSHPCGAPINLQLNWSQGPDSGSLTFSLDAGLPSVPTPVTVSYAGPTVTLPNGVPTPRLINLPVTGVVGSLLDVDFSFDGTTCTAVAGATTVGLNHTRVADLAIRLRGPSDTSPEILLMANRGGDGNNLCNTVFDDEAQLQIATVNQTAAPFSNPYRPEQALNAFDGISPNGTWRLSITDPANPDTGAVRAFSLRMTTLPPAVCQPPLGTTCDSIDFNNDQIANDPTDIEAFLSIYSGGPCIPAAASCNDVDFNNDGISSDPTDIEAFLSVYSGGPCF